MAIKNVPLAARGQTQVVQNIEPGDTLQFDFSLNDIVMNQRGDDLVLITNDEGTIVIKNFFLMAEAPQAPSILVDGAVFSAAQVVDAVVNNHGNELSTAAAAAPRGGGTSQNNYDAGDLLNGVNRLGALGTDQFGQAQPTQDLTLSPPLANDLQPSLLPFSFAATEDVPGTFLIQGNVLAGSSQGDPGGGFSWEATGQPALYGTLVRQPNGTFSYTLNNELPAVQALGVGQTLTEQFFYSYTDGNGDTVRSVLTITINGTNDAPNVAATAASVTEDAEISATGTLPTPADTDSNDTPEFVPQTNTEGTYGSFSVDAAGNYIYTLNNSLPAIQGLGVEETLTETFTYTVSDGHGGTATNTITITINGSEDFPTVAATIDSVAEDTETIATGTLSAPQDIDIHDILTFIPQSGTIATYGTFSVDSAGNYTYVLNNSLGVVQGLAVGETLTDVITYTVDDGHGGTATNTITITINGTEDIPTVAAATDTVTEDTHTVATGTLPAPADVDVHDILAFIPQPNTSGSYGSLTLNANGTYTYTLNNSMAAVQGLGVGEHLTDTFTYTVEDGQGGTATNTLTITINGTNDIPTVSPATDCVREDIDLVARGDLPRPNDIDVNDHLTFVPQTNTAGAYGRLSIDADGDYVYRLNNSLPAVQALGVGEEVTDVFIYTVTDGHGGTTTNTLTIVIHGTNDWPCVGATTDSVTEDTDLTAIGMLATPTDLDAHDIPVFIPRSNVNGDYGTLSFTATGAYVYTLNNSRTAVQQLGVGERLTDTFQYTVSDGHGGFATNTLTITINGTNDAPRVGTATATVTEDTHTTAHGTLPAPTDIDRHDHPTFIPQTGTAGTYGTLTLNASGSYTYSLNNSMPAIQGLGVGEHLTETFTYTVNDGHGGTATNTLTITINGTNDAPTVAAATDSVKEDTDITATGTLPTPADIDLHDNPTFVPQLNTPAVYGAFTVNAAGQYTYTLNNTLPVVQGLGVGEQLTETVSYTVSDGKGGTATNTLTITINGTNDIPTVAAAADNVTEDTDLTATGSLPAPADIDIHDTPTFVAQTGTAATYGSFSVNTAGQYIYTLNNALSAVQALGVGGTLTDVITYTVSDGHGGTATNTITITINGTNDGPIVLPFTDTVIEDTDIRAMGFLPDPEDVDDNAHLTFVHQQNTPGVYGSLNIEPNGHYKYTLDNTSPLVQALGAGEQVYDVFTYEVVDEHGAISQTTLTIVVLGTNDLPVVGATTDSVTEDTHTLASGMLPPPTDVDTNDILAFLPQTNSAGTYGSFTLAANGSYTYSLNNTLPVVQGLGVGEQLTETFTYTVSDGKGGTDSNTITITINGTNDIPVVGPATANVQEDTNTTASGFLPTPTDADVNDHLAFIQQQNTAGTYGTLSLQPNGHYNYSLNNALAAVQALGTGEYLTETFTYSVSDGEGGTTTNTLTITINGTNDTPTVGAATNTVTEDTRLTATGTLPTPTDIDLHDSFTYVPQANTAATYGTFTVNSSGVYTYSLNNGLTAVQRLGVGETLTDTVTYTVSDGKGGTATNTLTITINGTNDTPTVAAAVNAVSEDTQPTATGTLPTPADIDINDTHTFVAQPSSAGSYGTFTLNSNGAYTYTLNSALAAVQALSVGKTLTDTITYTVSDGKGGTGTNTLTITINGTNDIPTVAAATNFVTEESKVTATGTLPTPADVDAHDTLSFVPQAGTAATYGTFTVNSSGVYTYSLNNSLAAVQRLGVGETLTDTVTYTASDGKGGTATNTLTITINGTNDAPTVAAAVNAVSEDTQPTATGTLPTPADVDTTDTPTFVAQPSSAGSYGTFTLNSNGAYTYTLNSALAAVQALSVGKTLTDTITYTVSDGKGGTGTNTLTITINGTNDIPTVAAATNFVTEESKVSATGTLPTPADVDAHDTLRFVAQTNTAATFGTFTVNTSGVYTYSLNNSLAAVQRLGVGETLTDTVTYTVNDGKGGTATNTLTITINGTNDAPVVSAAANAVTEDSLPTATGTLPTPTDVDVNDTPSFVAQASTAATYGTFTLNSNGIYTYTLNNAHATVQALGVGEKLTDTITYTVSDGKGGTGTNTLTITINGTNDIPTVAAATTSIVEDTATKNGSLPAPADIDVRDVLAFVAQTNAPGAYGTLTVNSAGAYTYKLNNTLPTVQQLAVGQTLTDVFTYTVNDGKGGVAVNTLTVTIQGKNDNPVVAACTANVTEDTTLSASGTFPTPTDVDTGDTVAFIPRSNAAGTYGTLTYTAAGTYVYTLNNSLASVQAIGVGETVTDVFTYTVRDSQGGTATNKLTVTINGTNDNPVVGAATATVTEETKITATGTLPTPTDVDAQDILTFIPQASTAGSYGSVTIMANGSYTYTLSNSLPVVQALGVGETLTETFTYTVTDGKGGTATNTLTITVKGTNDTPYVAASTATVSEDTATTAIGVLSQPTDVDTNDTLTFSTMTNVGGVYGKLSVDASGNYVYVLNNSSSAIQSLGVGEHVTDTFVYTISDGKGGTASNTMTITINGTNDVPVVGAASNKVTEDRILSAAGQLPQPYDKDANDTPTFIPLANQAGSYGTLTLTASGTYTYQLNNASSAVQGLSQGQTVYDVFSYTVTDGRGGTTTNTLTITVNGTNDRPTVAPTNTTAIEDILTTVNGSLSTPVDIDVLDTVNFVPKAGEAGLYGTLQVNANGTYTYLLNNSLSAVQKLSIGDTLTDSFVYTVVDSKGAASSATLTVTIQGNNDAPVLGTRVASVTEDTHLVASGSLGGTDIDAHDSLTYTPVVNLVGLYGTLNINANGTYTYTLNNSLAAVQGLGFGETLQESFATAVTDGHGPNVPGTLTIVIRGTNDAPTIGAMGVTMVEDTTMVANGQLPVPVDADIHDHPVFTPMSNEPGLYGTLSIGANGAYTYSLNNSMPQVQQLGVGQTLTETFTYVVQDSNGGVGYNTLTITVQGTNDAPTVGAAYDALYFPDVKLEGHLPAPTDIDRGDTLTFNAGEIEGEYGTLTLNADGTYTYKVDQGHSIVAHPHEDETYYELFTYTVSDGHGGTASNTLTITLFPRDGNGNPHFHAVSAGDSVREDVKLTASGDLPSPGNSSSHVEYTPQSIQGMYGTLTLNEDGEYVYTLNNSLAVVQALNAGTSLYESFPYEVHDRYHSDTGTFTITINGTNDAPLVTPVTNTVTEDGVYVATGHMDGTDIDTDDLVIYEPKTGENGTYGLLILNSNGTYAYILNNNSPAVQAIGAGETATDVFTITAQDLNGATTTSTLSIVVRGTNDAPTVAGASATVKEDTITTVTGSIPTPADIDANDTFTVVPQTNVAGQYGTLTLNANGTYNYVLNNALPAVQALGTGQRLTDSFSYTIHDSQGAPATGTFTVNIQGTNDVPTMAPTAGAVTEDGTQYLMGMMPRPVDVDANDTHIFTLGNQAGQYGTFTITPNGFYTYVLNNTATAVQALGVGETLTENFAYTAKDSSGATVTSTFTITINGTNDVPTVTPSTALVAEDTPTVSGVLPTPADTDTNDVLTYTPQSATAGSYGALTLNAAGNYTYTLNNNLTAVQALQRGEQLLETFTYTVSDGHGGTATNVLTITISGTNDAPVVAPAVTNVREDTQTTTSGTLPAPTDVDANDTPSFIAQSNTAGSYGTFTLGVQGGYTYVLNNSLAVVQQLGVGETLTETITYTVTDNQGGTATNTLTITINGTNDIPVVGARTASIAEDTAAISGILPTPTDTDVNDVLTFTPISNQTGTYGSLTLGADGQYSYTLNNSLLSVQSLGVGQTRTEQFSYVVGDGNGGFATNTLTITINGTNDAPVVGASTKSINEGVATASGVLPTPTDVDASDTKSFIAQTGTLGSYGSLSLNTAGNYTYTLNNASAAVQGLGVGETATDIFTYTVTDNRGATATNTLTITINGTNDTPVAFASIGHATEDTGLTVMGTVPSPTDADIHDILGIIPIAVRAGTYGNLTLDADGHYTYTLNNETPAVQALGVGETATDVFTYTVTDNQGATSTATISITVHGTNDAPVVVAATAAVTEDTAITTTGTVPAPTDADSNDTLTITPIAGQAGTYGTLTLGANGQYTYTLNNASPAVQGLAVGETAADTFTYTVTDNHGASSTATISITINGSNDTPVAFASVGSTTEDAGVTVLGTITPPTDADSNDMLTIIAVTNQPGTYGTLTLDTNGHYSYTLNNAAPAVQALGVGQTATDVFTYTVTDNHGATSTATISITVHGTNDAPVVVAATAVVTEDTAITTTGTVPAPTDADGNDTLTITPIAGQAGTYGTLTLGANGQYTYTLNNTSPAVQGLGIGETAADTFTYTVTDNHGASSTATIAITIHGVNDTPLAFAATNDVTQDTNLIATGTVPAPTDADSNDTLTITPIAGQEGTYGTLTLGADGQYTYTLNNASPAVLALAVGETATDTFTYTVTDNQGATATSSINITVHGAEAVPFMAISSFAAPTLFSAAMFSEPALNEAATSPDLDQEVRDQVLNNGSLHPEGAYGSHPLLGGEEEHMLHAPGYEPTLPPEGILGVTLNAQLPSQSLVQPLQEGATPEEGSAELPALQDLLVVGKTMDDLLPPQEADQPQEEGSTTPSGQPFAFVEQAEPSPTLDEENKLQQEIDQHLTKHHSS